MEHDFDIDEFLQRPLFAHLATTSEHGPRESPVWFLWEGGALWLIGSSRDSFPRRIQRDPRCAIGIVDFDVHRGFLCHVGMRGTAEVVPLDRRRLHRLLRRYLGRAEKNWEPTFRAQVVDRLDLMVRFSPASIVARDQSYFLKTSPIGYRATS
jgi:nitroimidazol reductase NimA-like FMN-containing flavoprotein (pyridoxamine 5'-phosphate oxidase superfamily)